MERHELQSNNSTLQRRLGDYLLAEEVLTPVQLDEAIEVQCIYGGRLGTSLVELGLVSEDRLAQILSQQLKLHYIKPELLMNVAPAILQLVPKKLALKHRVVPYCQDGRRLFLAMSDTSNLTGIDELSFLLDHIIVPLAIPEIRLMLALKKHYQLELSPRFKSLSASLSKRAQAAAKTSVVVAKPADRAETEAWPLLGDAGSAEEDANEDADVNFATAPTELSYSGLCQQLAAAVDRDDIASALINYLGQEFPAGALLLVRPTSVSGWLAMSAGIKASGFDQFSIPLAEHSIFSQVVKDKSYALGSVTDWPQNSQLLRFLPATPPQKALVMPLMVRDRLVSLLYLQGQPGLLEKRLDEVHKLAKKAEMAFTLLILKHKILTT